MKLLISNDRNIEDTRTHATTCYVAHVGLIYDRKTTGQLNSQHFQVGPQIQSAHH